MTTETIRAPLRITRQRLVGQGACERQRRLFAETFGEHADVTEDNARIAADAGLDVAWIARRVLKRAFYRRFAAAYEATCDAFVTAITPADDTFTATVNAITSAYHAGDMTLADYEQRRDAADAAYAAACAPARRAQMCAVALAFVRLYREQEGQE